jgi:transcriptional regulator with XRE-family HTH domain
MAKATSLPAASVAHLERLGGRIRIARKRRGLSAQALAEKVGVFRKTIEALEAGKPGVSVGVLVTVLWVLGLDTGLASLADPDADTHGKALEAARRPKRVRTAVAAKEDRHDF